VGEAVGAVDGIGRSATCGAGVTAATTWLPMDATALAVRAEESLRVRIEGERAGRAGYLERAEGRAVRGDERDLAGAAAVQQDREAAVRQAHDAHRAAIEGGVRSRTVERELRLAILARQERGRATGRARGHRHGGGQRRDGLEGLRVDDARGLRAEQKQPTAGRVEDDLGRSDVDLAHLDLLRVRVDDRELPAR